MLPSIVEIYVIWHPDDDLAGAGIAEEFADRFQGSSFTGLMSGAVEVYVRSAGWQGPSDAPRSIRFPGEDSADGEAAKLVAIVPVLGMGLAAALERGGDPWRGYLETVAGRARKARGCVGVLPVVLDERAMQGTRLGAVLGEFQRLGGTPATSPQTPQAQQTPQPQQPQQPQQAKEPEQPVEVRCRDLIQAIAQLADAGGTSRVTVFISHTRHAAITDPHGMEQLIELVRSTIGETRLGGFLDANDLQPGCDWDKQLRDSAGTSALLAVRNEHYASRAWCQREMLFAKRAGMPVVILDALTGHEERGSFLMDHVPRVRVERGPDGWSRDGVRRGLNLLVSEHLKRILWRRQGQLAQTAAGPDVTWWAPHAPEPATLTHWLKQQRDAGRDLGEGPLRILHPDPPLGQDERLVLDEVASAGGIQGGLDVMTPQMLAARGGWPVSAP